MGKDFNSILMIGYGGPDKPEDIMPFLENVAKGFNIPRSRLEDVAHHYELIGGKSPLNELTYRQAIGLEHQLAAMGHDLPVFIGMRNWDPFIPDTLRIMKREQTLNSVGIILAAHKCDASWEKYMRDIEQAKEDTDIDLNIEYIEPQFDNPLFIESCADQIARSFYEIPDEERSDTKIIFTAHSIPVPMAEDSPYVQQLETSAKLIAEKVEHEDWLLCYQSRSGRPSDPWLEPDVCDVIDELAEQEKKIKHVIIQPIGFICDHVEVMYDIGIEAFQVCRHHGIKMHRANTVNDDPKFLKGLANSVIKLIESS
ncbi:MAG TPA: ferrochelatase [Thermodesulfobacteriota bacterium]|nr:ferrochelatase [Thermodesulfobacteriota bacterium]